MNDRLNNAMKQLAAEAQAATPPSIPGPHVGAAWDRRFRRSVPDRRAFPWWAVGAGIAAALVAVVFLAPKPRPLPQPVRIETANILLPPKTAPIPVESPARRPKLQRSKPRPKPAAEPVLTAEAEEPFIPIPYTAPLAPNERADVVRMDLPVSALIAAGLPVRVSDPGARARADLVVGEDGRARAVRLISVSDSTSRSIP